VKSSARVQLPDQNGRRSPRRPHWPGEAIAHWDRQLVAIDDPDRKRWASIEVLGDCGESNVGDGAVHNRHYETDRDCEGCLIALWLRQAIGVHDDRGRDGMTTL
jgi:hypothetical protein